MELVTITNQDRITQHMLNLLLSPLTKLTYRASVETFLQWVYENSPGSAVEALATYRAHLLEQGFSPSTCNRHLSSIRKWFEAAANLGAISDGQLAGIKRVENVKQQGKKVGIWLSHNQAQSILDRIPTSTLEGLRDKAILAVFLGVGLRVSEVANLKWEHVDQLDGVWVFRNLPRKHHRIQTIRVPENVIDALFEYGEALPMQNEYVFVSLSRANSGSNLTTRAIYNIVKKYAGIAPHQLRKTFASLMDKSGASTREIQQQLGHQSVSVTEVYLEDIRAISNAAVDNIGLRI